VSAPPVAPVDFPDPFVLNAGGSYYAFATNSGPTNVQVMFSADLSSWDVLGDALPAVAGWAQRGNTWAPAVLGRGDTFVLYYTVREPHSGRQALSVATASAPQGPFRDVSDGPFVFQLDLGGSIDPSTFVDTDAQAYLVWKADANALNEPSSLWGQPLSADGLSLLGSPTRLLDHDAGWENPLIEAPALLQVDGTYFLFYSANWWSSADYAIGYATADSALGPYTKVTTGGPWFAADGAVAGPGGQEFFTDAGGSVRMAYHGWQPGQIGYPGGARTLRLATVTFSGATPTIGDAVGTGRDEEAS
jgi:beta-xylosidase